MRLIESLKIWNNKIPGKFYRHQYLFNEVAYSNGRVRQPMRRCGTLHTTRDRRSKQTCSTTTCIIICPCCSHWCIHHPLCASGIVRRAYILGLLIEEVFPS